MIIDNLCGFFFLLCVCVHLKQERAQGGCSFNIEDLKSKQKITKYQCKKFRYFCNFAILQVKLVTKISFCYPVQFIPNKIRKFRQATTGPPITQQTSYYTADPFKSITDLQAWPYETWRPLVSLKGTC